MARGELGLYLSARGADRVVRAMADTSRALQAAQRELRGVAVASREADAGLSRVYRGEHLRGVRALDGALRSTHGTLGRLTGGVVGLGRSFAPLVGIAGIAGVVIGLKQAVASSAALEAGLVRLQTQAGVPAASNAALRAGALNIAAETGVKAVDVVNGGLYHVESAFASQHLSDSAVLADTRAAAKLSRIGGADMESTTQAIVGTMSSGVRGATTAEGTAAALNAIVGAGDMKLPQLNEAIKSGILPTAKALGLSLNDVGAAIATMTDNVTPASTSSLKLSTSLLHMVKPGTEATTALHALGLDQLQLSKSMQDGKGLLPTLDLLHQRLAKLPKERQNAYISAIFGGTKGSTPIFTLFEEWDKYASKVTDLGKRSGAEAFSKAWEQTLTTFESQRARLSAAVNNMLIGVGDRVRPVAARAASFLSDVVTGGTRPDEGHTAFDRANASPYVPSAGSRLHRAGVDVGRGQLGAVAADLGITGTAGQFVTRALLDVKAIVHDVGRIVHDDVLPGLHTAGTLFGGAVGVGLHLLRDVLDVIAAHSGTVKVVVVGLLSLFAVRQVGAGIAAIGRLPGQVSSMAGSVTASTAAVGRGFTTLRTPVASFRTAVSDGMLTAQRDIDRVTRAQERFRATVRSTTAAVEEESVVGARLGARLGVGGAGAVRGGVLGRTGRAARGAGGGLLAAGLAGADLAYAYSSGTGAQADGGGIKAGSALMAAGTGALTGAAVGSVVPVVGTAVGAAAGAVLGAGANLAGQFLHLGDATKKAADAVEAQTLALDAQHAADIAAKTSDYKQAFAANANDMGKASQAVATSLLDAQPQISAALANAHVSMQDLAGYLLGQQAATQRVTDALGPAGLLPALSDARGEFVGAGVQAGNLATNLGQASDKAGLLAASTATLNDSPLFRSLLGGSVPGVTPAPGAVLAPTVPGADGLSQLLQPPPTVPGRAVLAPATPGPDGLSQLLFPPTVPGRASGGPMAAWHPYRVGERGTEIGVPAVPSYMMNAQETARVMLAQSRPRAGSAGVVWTGNVIVHPSPGMDERALADAAADAVVRKVAAHAARQLG